MSEKRFKVIDNSFSMWIVDTTLKEDKHEGAIYTAYDMCRKLNELYEENEQLKELVTRAEEEKEYYADLYNKCRRLKLSDEAIKKAYADLNRREIEKHSQGNAAYTAKMNWNEVIY